MLDQLKMIVISDSSGETGSMLVRAAISQFKNQDYETIRYPYIMTIERLQEVLEEVAEFENYVLFSTLVSEEMVHYLQSYTAENNILNFDIMSPILGGLSDRLGMEPSAEPGIIRKVDEAYYSRVAAIEFAVKYDDGKDPRGLAKADLVLVGISRTSKTPLSMYLANKNIKVANVPLVLESPPPKELFEISARKIIGLTNSPENLNQIREERLLSLGVSSGSSYADIGKILDELDYSEQIMKRIGCPVVNVENRAIEETSGIILALLKKNGLEFDY